MKASSQPSSSDLAIVKNDYSDRNYNIKISIPEFSCVCPKTGLPDYATIEIHYIPDQHIVELKSLKLYIIKFREIGIFHEHVTNQIMEDFKMACSPKKIKVFGRFHPRGGIKTEVEAYWPE